MNLKILLFTAFFLPFFGCQPETGKQENTAPALKVTVEKVRQLESIPSGSGLVKHEQHFYLISDDSPYFFKLDQKLNILAKNAILPGIKTAFYRLPKLEKPDYESAAIGSINGEQFLLAFGSGSKSPERDSLLLVPLNQLQAPQTYSLKPLYERIKQQANLPDAELNVEGSAIIGEDLFLLNRGQNVLAQMNWAKTVAFLKQKPRSAPPEIKTYRIPLPDLKGIPPGFSGACALGSENKLIFTASVEVTRNWIADGEILGSFIGIIDLEKLQTKPLESIGLLRDKNGKPVVAKVESVELLSQESSGKLHVLALTDDDMGGSSILEITLQP